MKKIFAVLMSLHLILTPVAFAQEDKYQTTGSGGDGASQWIDGIMMTGSGVIGSSFINCRSSAVNVMPTFSHYLFMAGALTLLFAEISAAEDQIKGQQEMEREIAALSRPSEGGVTQGDKDKQLVLIALKRTEEANNLEALKTRMEWMTAAEIAYGLAALAAVFETSMYFLTKTLKNSIYPATVAAGNALGYNNWSLSCNGDKALREAYIMAIGVAYSVAPSALQGNFSGVLTKGLSTAAFFMLLKQFTGKVGDQMKSAINSAPGRVFVFGAFALLAEQTRKGLKTRKERAEENLALFDKAINEWNKATVVTTEIHTDLAQTDAAVGAGDVKTNIKTTSSGQIKPLPSTTSGKCFSSIGSLSSESCKGPKFNLSKISLPTNMKLPSVLSNGFSNAFGMADAMASGDAAGAKVFAGNLSANASAIKKATKDLIEEHNKELVKNGHKPIDFDNEVQKQLIALKQEMKDNASSLTGLNPNLADSQTSNDDVSDSKTPKVVVATDAPAAIPLVNAPDVSFGSDEKILDENLVRVSGANASIDQDLDIFKSEQDISKSSEVSIFKQVSNRYFLNYSKFFDRKKLDVGSDAPKN